MAPFRQGTDLSKEQEERLEAYADLLLAFNRRINLISRDDEARVRSVHLPHVLSLTMRPFVPGSHVVDWGTGGGLPAIPLAIACPHVTVHAVDAVEKKILAVRSMARRLNLKNFIAWSGDAARWPGRATFSVSRATAPLSTLWRWHSRVFEPAPHPVGIDGWKPGLLCLKGGALEAEMEDLRAVIPHPTADRLRIETIPVVEQLSSERFSDKVIVHAYLERYGA